MILANECTTQLKPPSYPSVPISTFYALRDYNTVLQRHTQTEGPTSDGWTS